MKLTAFLGSPRKGGNTDILAERVLAGASEAGLETATVALRTLKIHACTGCEKCWSKDRPCVFDDDMAQVYQAIAESDVLLFATPVYWYGPTTIMKTIIDRLVVLNRPQGRPMIEGKAAILAIAYEEEGPAAAEPLIKMFELSFDYLKVRLIGQAVVDGVGPKGAVLEKPEALAQAFEIGRSLGTEKA
jgi:multimeric flavodoxin WrbA